MTDGRGDLAATARCAAGFRVHMGSATVVVVTLDGDATTVRSRRRIGLAPDHDGYPYHALSESEPEARADRLAAGIAHVRAHVVEVVADLLAREEADAAGVVVGRGVARIPVEKVLASSRLFHTAEGAVYAEAVAAAIGALGIRGATVGFAEAEAHPFWNRAADLREQVGAPWQKDHKLATVAALVAAVGR